MITNIQANSNNPNFKSELKIGESITKHYGESAKHLLNGAEIAAAKLAKDGKNDTFTLGVTGDGKSAMPLLSLFDKAKTMFNVEPETLKLLELVKRRQSQKEIAANEILEAAKNLQG